jgi:polysaccharide deacetylase family protein (PEP-CTERM system associated)
VNALTVDVEEYYHAEAVAQALGPRRRGLPSRVARATERLLDLCDRLGARATFFTLGVVAHRHPGLVRRIVERGHELASHGWDHTPVYELGAEGFRRDLRRSRHALEQAAGRPVRGYRAPTYSLRADTPWALPVLCEEGFLYDSSVHPVAHDRYAFPDAPRFPHVATEVDGTPLWEVPVGTARFAGRNLPVGGGFFRLLPLGLVRAAIASVNRREGRPFLLYVHPWELDPGQPRLPLGRLAGFRHYVGLAGAEAKLAAVLGEFAFISVLDAFPELGAARPAAAPSLAS